MQLAAYFYVGKISRKYSYKGELIISVDSDYPEIIEETESVYITIGDNLVPFFMQRKSWQKKLQLRVKFEDVDSEPDANQLLNKKVYLPNSMLPESDGLDFYNNEIIGFKVKDKQFGLVGVVKDVNEKTPQTLLEVQDDSGIVFIPVNEVFIKEIDRKNQTIFVETPEGLLDLRY